MCCRAYTLLLREGLFVEDCMQLDWTDAADGITLLVQTCVRKNIIHHARACANERALLEHVLFLPPKHTAPKESALLMLMHRCVSRRQCLIECHNSMDHHTWIVRSLCHSPWECDIVFYSLSR
jgi:hypothetical protein